MRLGSWSLLVLISGVRGDIGLVMPSATVLGQNVTLSWTRARGDPTHFFIQSIKFSSPLSPTPLLFEVNVLDTQLSGSVDVVSNFAGPHIVVALDPSNGSHLYATSNAFSVDQSTDTAPNPFSTSPASSTTVPLASISTSQRPSDLQPCNSTNSSAMVGAVLGVLLGLSLILCAFLLFKLYKRRIDNRSTFPHEPLPSATTSRSYDNLHPSLLQQSQAQRSSYPQHIEPFTAQSTSFSSSGDPPYSEKREREAPPGVRSHHRSQSSSSVNVLQRLNILERAVLSQSVDSDPSLYLARPPSYNTDHT